MHIELTDLLRCPNDHPEAFLVLLPEKSERRLVTAGHLGCPICGWSTSWDEGIPVLGEAPPPTTATPPVDAAELVTLLGLEGPGGWLVLAGEFGRLAHECSAALPEVKIVAVNPPPDVGAAPMVSIVRASVWPIKRHSARGVAIGSTPGGDPRHAIASTLPGLRIVGIGTPPAFDETAELLAATDELWVARHR